MGSIRIRIKNGHKYAYEVSSYRDKETKKVKTKETYLGKVIDEDKGIFEKHISKKLEPEKMILNFGDSYAVLEFLKTTSYYNILKEVFKEDVNTLLTLVLYKMFNNNAMKYVTTWQDGNYARIALENSEVSSQKTSEFLGILGDERIHRKFFEEYLKLFEGKKISTLVDSTGLPNHIAFYLNEWSNHNGILNEETRLLYVIDRNTGMPTYFRYMAGNIVDVSTLNNTIDEMKEYNVDIDYSIVDAGYYSEDNIKGLYEAKIAFLTRLPSNRKLYKEVVKEHGANLEKDGKIVRYGARTMYIKRVTVGLFENTGYAYIVLDIKRYADEVNKYIISAKDDGLTDEEIRDEIQNKGKLILISSEKIKENEVIPLYYTRQRVENVFGVLKSEIGILPLRVHSVTTFRGYILLNFITLIIELSIQKKLGNNYTLEELFMSTKNLMCKVYDDKILVDEPSKQIKEMFKLLDIQYKRKISL